MNSHKRLDIENDILKNVYANPYYWNKPDYFNCLRSIVKNYPTTYFKVLYSRYAKILQWINDMTPKLSDPRYKTSTKIFWILSGMRDFNCCSSRSCLNKVGINQNVNITRGYTAFCSLKCSQADSKTKLKIRNSVMDRVKNDPDFFKKAETKEKAAKLKNGKPKNWNNRDKARSTCMMKYGTANQMQSPDVIEKAKVAKKLKYGNEFFTNRSKARSTLKTKYGTTKIMRDDKCVKRALDTKMRKYGTPTLLNKFNYDGQIFDSKPELALYIWLKDQKYEFKYHPKVSFDFTFKDKTHKYFPDFIINGIPVEIKGDQFFKDDGTMYCPYKNKKWSDNEYNEICALYEAKRQCMLKNNVKILKSAEYVHYIRYVQTEYGNDFFKKYKNRK